MHTGWPSNSSAPRPLLVVALSARALAQSAARAGFAPLAIDLFGDLDTRAVCTDTAQIGWDGTGFPIAALAAAADRLDPAARCGVVYGSGFEADPARLTAFGTRTVYGNTPHSLHLAKDPLLPLRLGLPCPQTRLEPPADPSGWLVKQRGGSGGFHVRPATAAAAGDRVYYQRLATGRSLSAAFLADGTQARLLGFCEQWCDPGATTPAYAYGGAVTLEPDDPPPGVVRELAQAAQVLTAACGLRGLGGLDVLLDGDRWQFIDLNPRPGATVELYENHASLLPLHLAAHWTEPPPRSGARAHAIVYAPQPLTLPHGLHWPDWVSDRSAPGTVIAAGAPVCTVHATAKRTQAARATVLARHQQLLETLASWHLSPFLPIP